MASVTKKCPPSVRSDASVERQRASPFCRGRALPGAPAASTQSETHGVPRLPSSPVPLSLRFDDAGTRGERPLLCSSSDREVSEE
eukprot:4014014-Prymnesium_polylepis.1